MKQTTDRWRPINPQDREKGLPPWDGHQHLVWMNTKQPEPGGEMWCATWDEKAGGLFGPRWWDDQHNHSAEPDVATHWMPKPPDPMSPYDEQS